MSEAAIVGLDLAKNVFQRRGTAADGLVVFRKKLSRQQFARFMANHAMRGGDRGLPQHTHWAREPGRHGHHVQLIAPHCIKPFLKRRENDASDAKAIVEAAMLPSMRFVEPKTVDQQARAVAFRAREQLIKQQTESINALRAHLFEFGHVAAEGIGQGRPLLSGGGAANDCQRRPSASSHSSIELKATFRLPRGFSRPGRWRATAGFHEDLRRPVTLPLRDPHPKLFTRSCRSPAMRPTSAAQGVAVRTWSGSGPEIGTKRRPARHCPPVLGSL